MAKTNGTVSIEELRRVLSYDPDTGELRWLAKVSRDLVDGLEKIYSKLTQQLGVLT